VRDIIYGRKFGMALTMDVLKPAKPSGVGVLVMVSGGFSSDMAMVDAGFLGPAWLKPLTDRGQTVFLICHGSQPKFVAAEIIQDVLRASRFIHAHAADYGVDPDRLGVTGASSGGFLSLSLATAGGAGDPAAKDPVDRASSRVQAVACFFPPTDLVDYGQSGRTFLEFEPVKFVWHTIGVGPDAPRDQQIKVLRDLSPLAHVTKDAPPTLIFHGDADVLVPYEQSQRFIAKLDELKVPNQLITRKGAGHGWPGFEKDFEVIGEWFDKYLAARQNDASGK
jgi:acetyl esterase/lipase